MPILYASSLLRHSLYFSLLLSAEVGVLRVGAILLYLAQYNLNNLLASTWLMLTVGPEAAPIFNLVYSGSLLKFTTFIAPISDEDVTLYKLINSYNLLRNSLISIGGCEPVVGSNKLVNFLSFSSLLISVTSVRNCSVFLLASLVHNRA